MLRRAMPLGCTSAVLVHQPPPPIKNPPFTIHHPPFTIHHSPSTIHHSPFTVHRSPFTIHNSPFNHSTIHHSRFTIRPPHIQVVHVPVKVARGLQKVLLEVLLVHAGAIHPQLRQHGEGVTHEHALDQLPAPLVGYVLQKNVAQAVLHLPNNANSDC